MQQDTDMEVWKMGKMTVYHGSYTTVRKPDIVKGHNTKDFGPGFYCTVIREQAERWAKRYDNGVVNTYTVRLDTSLDILEFSEMTEEWLDFIIACRNGEPYAFLARLYVSLPRSIQSLLLTNIFRQFIRTISSIFMI